MTEMMESNGKWWSVLETRQAWQGEADCDGLVTKMSEQDGKREEKTEIRDREAVVEQGTWHKYCLKQ